MTSAPPFAATVEHVETVLRGVRTSRASAGLVEHLPVEVYGTSMALRDLATITTPDARTLQIDPWDKSQLPSIEKAVTASPLGVHPVIHGTVLRITLPPLTDERRRELTKLVRAHLEEARIAIRQVREKILRDLKGQKVSGALSEDAFERERKKLQSEVDAAIADVDRSGKMKEADILGDVR